MPRYMVVWFASMVGDYMESPASEQTPCIDDYGGIEYRIFDDLNSAREYETKLKKQFIKRYMTETIRFEENPEEFIDEMLECDNYIGDYTEVFSVRIIRLP